MKSLPKYTRIEKLLDTAVLIGLLFLWVFIWDVNQKATKLFPTHFNIQGTADAFGNASHLYTLAFINTLLILGLYVLKFKNIPLNFGREVTLNNKDKLKQVMHETLSVLALSILIIFGIILYETIAYKERSTPYSFILIFFSIKIPIVFYFLKTQNIKE